MSTHTAHIEVDPALLSNTTNARNTPSGSGTPLQMTSAPRKKKHRLDAASDNLFAEIRDQNFAVVGEMLHKVARRINEDYEGRHQAKTVQQIREFVGRLGGLQSEHQSLRLHTSLTEQIMGMTGTEEFNRALEIQQNLVAGVDLAAQQAAIEDLINAEAPMLLVLRLLCLSSIVGGGIKPKNLEFVKREILQTYGYEHLPLLLALTRVGLLTKATSSSSRSSTGFAAVRRPLKLINDDVDERAPTDISYVYSGYAPLSVRLVQAIAQKEALVDASAGAPRTARNVLPRAHPIVGWRGFEDVVRSLPGATFDEEQSVPNSSTARRPAPHDPEATTTTIVFFLGGVTYTEIAALRFMSRQTRNRRFLVATTNMIGGNTLVSSFGNVGNEAKPMVLAPTL